MGFVTDRIDRSTNFGWYGVKTLQLLTSSLLYPNEHPSIANLIFHIEGCDTLKQGQASRELRETCSDRRKWGKNSLRLDQSQKSAGNVSRVLLGQSSSNTTAFYLHRANQPAFVHSTNVFVSADSLWMMPRNLASHYSCLTTSPMLHKGKKRKRRYNFGVF